MKSIYLKVESCTETHGVDTSTSEAKFRPEGHQHKRQKVEVHVIGPQGRLGLFI